MSVSERSKMNGLSVNEPRIVRVLNVILNATRQPFGLIRDSKCEMTVERRNFQRLRVWRRLRFRRNIRVGLLLDCAESGLNSFDEVGHVAAELFRAWKRSSGLRVLTWSTKTNPTKIGNEFSEVSHYGYAPRTSILAFLRRATIRSETLKALSVDGDGVLPLGSGFDEILTNILWAVH